MLRQRKSPRPTVFVYPYPAHEHWEQDIDRRYQHLMHRLEEHGSLPIWDLPQVGDEALLGLLAAQAGGNVRPDYLAIENWLTTAYIATAGDYGDPEVRAESDLPRMVQQRAHSRYGCTPACNPPLLRDVDKLCRDGEHRLQAVAAHHLATFLAQAQFQAVRESADR